jgi:hypothetical protein
MIHLQIRQLGPLRKQLNSFHAIQSDNLKTICCKMAIIAKGGLRVLISMFEEISLQISSSVYLTSNQA